MGCIMACLRYTVSKKINKAQLKSSPIPSKTKEPLLLSEDRFASAFESEGSTCVQVADLKFEDNRDNDIFDRELKDQVKILKSCGAILETPAELRKASSNSSCIPATSIKKLVWEEHWDDSEFAQNSAASSNFGENQVQTLYASASKTHKLALDEEQEESGSESFILDVSPSLGGKNSPYPTPLQLTDEMETPCTVYPSTRENLRWKNGRVGTQYVYPELGKENYSSVKKLRNLSPFSNSRLDVERPILKALPDDKLSP